MYSEHILKLKHEAKGTNVSEADLLVKQQHTFPNWLEKRVSIEVGTINSQKYIYIFCSNVLIVLL